jgi:type VI secretion system protein ImpE
MNARDFYQAGQLDEAIQAMKGEVKQHPTDTGRRGFLCELLCFAGELDRADQQLDTLSGQDPQTQMGIGMFRHLIRAEQARQQFYAEGRLPEFLDQPSPRMKLHLEASILLREGKGQEAAKILAQAEEQRPTLSGTVNGKPFSGWRDLDDLTASFLEVLTSNGKYYWIPMERIDSMEFRAPVRPRDLLWRRVHMVVQGGPDGEVFLPALYAGSHAEKDAALRLGRASDWRGGNGEPVRGIGQRSFLVGEDTLPILEWKDLALEAVPA